MKKDIEEYKRVLEIEAQSILDLREKNHEALCMALDLLESCQGKVVLTGMGKSGIIARKISSTLSSTGTPSLYLHPAESAHGDLGVITSQDLVWAISYGGESGELLALYNYCARKNIPLIGMSSSSTSTLAQASKIFFDIAVKKEACPLGLAPTSSTTATLALGDAIAMALLKRRGFKEENFGEFHPGGSLGRRLLTRVADVMHTGDAVPLVPEAMLLRDVIGVMTNKEVRGVAGVVSDDHKLIGVITDGDIRRRLKGSENPLSQMAKEIMNLNPKTIDKSEPAEKALYVMEQFSIQNLFVLDKSSGSAQKPIGLLHLQDLLKAKVR